jgi:hypothetical protein
MRRTQAMAVLVGLVGALTLLVAPPAPAQTGYPPGLCTVVTGSQNVGSVNIGLRFVLQVAPTCLFTPGAPVTVVVNGVDIPGKTAEPGGFVLVDVTVISATQLSIDDPVLTPAFCGTNTVTARGPSSTAQGGTSTQTATFTLNCPAGTGTGTGTQRPATATGAGLLSRTGADTLRYTAIALALMVAGALALVVTRRRRFAS